MLPTLQQMLYQGHVKQRYASLRYGNDVEMLCVLSGTTLHGVQFYFEDGGSRLCRNLDNVLPLYTASRLGNGAPNPCSQ
jgi:hypothetical protein